MKTTTMLGLLGLVSTLGTLQGCHKGRSQARVYDVHFVTRTDEGDILPGVRLEVAGKKLGATDESGSMTAQLRGREGDEVAFDVDCPKGYRKPAEMPSLRLRTLANGGGRPGAELEIRCSADQRLAALLVSAPGFPGLPVLVHGRELGRTDESGIAHLLLEGKPRSPLRVVLDTSSRPFVIPPSPHKDVRIAERDEIVLFAPEIREILPKPKKAPRKREEPKAPEVVRPEQLK